ncbi:hypothetical protein WOLCODRAFT_151779 [Wolfiporia cocos MD-104 SS10]|uniref:Uncharacterized protein n=1 Tax=Wolfiporia cocos (strain MD-104) TaxID=742152 RepID=A0A2H3JHR7_WOLCO|nr:hypothetical protein WOLCODRAFT_151779 [Wolfiporia cocos MD-104 SS10]
MSPKGTSVAQYGCCSERRWDASSDLEPHTQEELTEDLRRQLQAVQGKANSAASELVRVRGEADIERKEAKVALKAALNRRVEDLLLELKIAKVELRGAEVVWESERNMLYDRIKECEKLNVDQAEALKLDLALAHAELDVCRKELDFIKEKDISSPLQREESLVLRSDIIQTPTTVEESAKDNARLLST